MGILASTFDRLWRVKRGSSLAVVVGTDDQALPPLAQTTEKTTRRMPGVFAPNYDDYRQRLVAIKDYEMIDSNVPELSRSLTIIAANATSGDPSAAQEDSFKLQFAPSFGAQNEQIVNELVFDRLALDKRLGQVVRNANKFGDFFGEIIVDKQGLIWKVKNLDPALTERIHDEYDRHLGFRYKGYKDSEQSLAWWQVIHLMHDPEYGARYGRSLFAGGGRALAYRILAVRDSLAYETLNHASARNAIIMARPERWGREKVRAWVEDLGDRLSRDRIVDDSGQLSRRAIAMLNGQDVVLDYPVDQDGKGNAPVISPLNNAPVMDIARIAEHFQDLLFAVTGVPKAFLGVERGREGLGGNRLEVQDMQFSRQLRREQLDAAWFVGEVIRRQFVLLGRPLPADAVQVVMPDLRRIDEKAHAETMYLRAQAAKYAGDAGWPSQFIWQEIWNDGEEFAAEELADQLDFDPKEIKKPEPPPLHPALAAAAAGQIAGKAPNPAQEPPKQPGGADAKQAAERFAQGLSLIRAAAQSSRPVALPVAPVP